MHQRPIRILIFAAFLAANGLLCLRVRVYGENQDLPIGKAVPMLGAIIPCLSDAGDAIAFSYQGAIWRMPRAGGVMTQLTDEEGFDVEPAWSPDGTRIAFLRTRNFSSGPLRLIDARDGSPVSMGREVNAQDRLFFDRSGKRILGKFQRPGGETSLCWLEVASGDLGPKLSPETRDPRYALSYDGTKIALATTQDRDGEQGGNNGPQCDIWVMPSEGGELKKIMRFPGRVYELSWDSRGSSLYVTTNVGGAHNDLWEVPLSDPIRGARKITFGQADEGRSVASRDGRWLLYTDNRRGPTALIFRDLEGDSQAAVPVSEMKFVKPPGTMSLEIGEEPAGSPVTARVSVHNTGGKYYAPHGSLYRMLRGDVHFYCAGKAEFNLPAGQYLVKIARGPEYPVFRKEIEIAAGRTTAVATRLKRWTNQRAQGWHSGESHIHANYGYGHWYNSPRTMLAQCAGEDLMVANFMVANSEADGVFDREYFRGSPDPLSTAETVLYWNEEFRSTIWGHLTLLKLKHLVEPIFTGFEQTTHPGDYPTNADIADLTHDQDGHVNFTHPAQNLQDLYLSAYSAKSLPLDVALGKIDSIDVMGTSNPASMELWYRLLNCGFQIPASAGTDCFLNRIASRLPGQERVYVHVAGEFSYSRWIDNLQAGRTFVTNGPMFEFRVNGHMSGTRVELESSSEVRVQGCVKSLYPLNRVEIVYNGSVVRVVRVEGKGMDVPVDEKIPIPRSGWIALRAAGPNQADQPGGDVFGHTGAVYLHKDGHPIEARKDAQYFLDWIDRLETDVRRRDRVPSRHKAHVQSQFSGARSVYRRLVGAGAT